MPNLVQESVRKVRTILGLSGRARRRARAAGIVVEQCEERLLLSQWEGLWSLTLKSPLPPPPDDPGPYQMNINPDGLSTVDVPGQGGVRLTHLRFSKNDERMFAKVKTGDFKGKVRGVMLPSPTIPKFDLTVELVKPLDQLYDFDASKGK
ncbi:MAG: hypothetical protein U0903_17565 [Planctomycetales bacterium]